MMEDKKGQKNRNVHKVCEDLRTASCLPSFESTVRQWPLQLDPRLKSTSSFVTNLILCQVRLSDNAAFPWILLIPNQESIIEIIDLSSRDQQILTQEIAQASQVMQTLFHPDKLNVASLGNIVPQLHIHIIARYKNDKAWPNPVWNTVSETYEPAQKSGFIKKLKDAFAA